MQCSKFKSMCDLLQTARLLFKMSLLHLPLLMLLAVIHRQPNEGNLTWRSLMEQVKQRAEIAEQSLLTKVHGPGADRQVDSMIFPFSPPLRMPCPYTALKLSLGPRASVTDHSAAEETIEENAAVPWTRNRRYREEPADVS